MQIRNNLNEKLEFDILKIIILVCAEKYQSFNYNFMSVEMKYENYESKTFVELNILNYVVLISLLHYRRIRCHESICDSFAGKEKQLIC